MKHNPKYVQVCIIEEKTTSEMNSGSVAECWFCFILFYLFPKINSNEQEKYS